MDQTCTKPKLLLEYFATRVWILRPNSLHCNGPPYHFMDQAYQPMDFLHDMVFTTWIYGMHLLLLQEMGSQPNAPICFTEWTTRLTKLLQRNVS